MGALLKLPDMIGFWLDSEAQVRNLYAHFNQLFSGQEPIFLNLASEEQRHIDAIEKFEFGEDKLEYTTDLHQLVCCSEQLNSTIKKLVSRITHFKHLTFQDAIKFCFLLEECPYSSSVTDTHELYYFSMYSKLSRNASSMPVLVDLMADILMPNDLGHTRIKVLARELGFSNIAHQTLHGAYTNCFR